MTSQAADLVPVVVTPSDLLPDGAGIFASTSARVRGRELLR